jgi:hypothetical protein
MKTSAFSVLKAKIPPWPIDGDEGRKDQSPPQESLRGALLRFASEIAGKCPTPRLHFSRFQQTLTYHGCKH